VLSDLVTGRLDESLLFNGAGMIQFKPYFLGLAKPDYPKLTTCQKCVRTGDIEEVGDDTHLTFFEMLGNFSFGDYFKEEAIRMSWEFLTDSKWLGLDPARLSFSIFEDDDDAERVWRECGARFVVRLDAETNFWPADAVTKGPPGPCGPNSEMFFWVRDDVPPPNPANYTKEQWQADDAAGNWVEIWNDVFIQYDWQGTPKPSGKGYDKTGMPFADFIFFMLAEEDKTSEASLRYWFNVCDLDGDGVLTYAGAWRGGKHL
jgi:alanyl-tRNA synthetase